MIGDDRMPRKRTCLNGATQVFELHALTERRLRRTDTKTNDYLRLQYRDLSLKPWAAGGDFAVLWMFVQTSLAASLPFEMFYRIRDVDLFAREYGSGKRSIEQLARWAYEGQPFDVFSIARLFAD